MSTTLSDFITRVRERADMEGSEFVTDTELTTYINASIQELYDILVSSFQDYYLNESGITTLNSGQSTISLPADFYKLRGVDRQVDNSNWQTITPFSFTERNDRTNTATYVGYYSNDSGIRYRLQGSQIRLTPQDNCAGNYRLWYIPKVTLLSSNSDSFDGINGWEEYVIVDCAIKCLQKEESDVSVLLSQKQALIQRIRGMANNRDSGAPEVIVPVMTYSNFWGF